MDAARPPAESGLTIALLHPCYWPEVRRGSERFVHDLGKRLAARGHRVRLITSHPGATSEYVEDGIEVVRLHRPRGRRLQLGLRDQYLTHVPAAMRALSDADPDVVHALYPVDAWAAARWSRARGRPLVFSLMGMPRPETGRRRIWRRIIVGALSRADVSVCLSRQAAQATETAFGETTRVIHPGVDLDLFRQSAPRAPVPTVLCPADLNDVRKRGPLVRRAFRILRSHHPEARLVLSAPTGSLPGAVDEPGIEYTNLDSESDLARAYSEAWITVLLSQAEAFGLVLAESLACGTPVLGARGGGADEIVDSDEVGRLIDPGDPEETAAAIAGTMSDSENVRSACVSRGEQFSADRCAQEYEALYRAVLAR
jgi:glycosyltransferase involved in cell wall biosynthesis